MIFMNNKTLLELKGVTYYVCAIYVVHEVLVRNCLTNLVRLLLKHFLFNDLSLLIICVITSMIYETVCTMQTTKV